ncbi:MAG: TetR/AcrR family transcriptional regulator [Beijerinckiaceae bacterium]|nr:TetR/AcrR family transcriptional regulator [Beijerinckiaceae bacterium]
MRKPDENLHEDRRHQILDAAGTCFARSGFHQTTMQDVAAEAGMSPGNIYRYFASKDALIAGMTERDRAMILQDFSAIADETNLIDALAGLARKHLVEGTCGQSALALEIWSEGARNPAVGAMIRGIERAVHEGLCDVLRRVQSQGRVAPGVNVDDVARFIGTLVDGLFKRRALEDDFDGEWAVALIVAVTEAALSGRLALNATSLREPMMALRNAAPAH